MNDGNVVRLPRRPLPEDPMEGLRVLVEEYTAASNRDRNYRSCHYSYMFHAYLTDLMPLFEQRHEDMLAALGAAVARAGAKVAGDPPPRPDLKVVK